MIDETEKEVPNEKDSRYNRQIITFVAYVVGVSELLYTYLSIHNKPEAAILGIATYALGILTGSSLRPSAPKNTTTIPDSTGTVNVNTGSAKAE